MHQTIALLIPQRMIVSGSDHAIENMFSIEHFGCHCLSYEQPSSQGGVVSWVRPQMVIEEQWTPCGEGSRGIHAHLSDCTDAA